MVSVNFKYNIIFKQTGLGGLKSMQYNHFQISFKTTLEKNY